MKRKLFLFLVLGLFILWSGIVWAGDYCPTYYVKAEKSAEEMSWYRVTAFVGAAVPQSPEALQFNLAYGFKLEKQVGENSLIGVKYDQVSYGIEYSDFKSLENHLGGEGRVFLFPIGTKTLNPYVVGSMSAVNLAGVNAMLENQNDWEFDMAYGLGFQWELWEGVALDIEMRYLDVEDNKGIILRAGPSIPFGL